MYRSDQDLGQWPPDTSLVSAKVTTEPRIVGVARLDFFLGAETENGESFFARFSEHVTAEHAKHLILALYKKFKHDLIAIFDDVAYFRASTVTDLAARDGGLYCVVTSLPT